MRPMPPRRLRSSVPAISRSRMSNSWLVWPAQDASSSSDRTAMTRMAREGAPRCAPGSRLRKGLAMVGGVLRALVFAVLAAAFVAGQFGYTWRDSERYGYLTDI